MKKLTDTFLPSVVLMLPRMFVRGFILWCCWQWFIMPLLHVPAMPLWYAIPISGLVSILTFEQIGEMTNTQEAWVRVGQWTLGATVFLVSAYIMHVLVPA